jgi:D-alanyl-D-alanine carboxypeptidase/D-alanyl-D-alanine-endopeptidase (penicillin-binding protein 4)
VHERLAFVESAPLGVLVHALGKDSDNFFAETILKALGAATKAAPGTSKDGAEAVLAWMKDTGALEPGVTITNGSGLFDANRVTATSLAVALRQAFLSPRIGPEFVSNLAVGGIDGTLRARFKKDAVRRVVRAKTGTLDRVVALSGYVLPPPGKLPIAFSFIVEGAPGKHAEVRDHIDRTVEALTEALWDGSRGALPPAASLREPLPPPP